MELITFRVDKNLVNDLKLLQKYDDLDKSSAARKAFELGVFEWKKREAIKLILKGKISIGKASELIGISLYELLEIFKERKIDFISVTEQELDKEVKAAKR